MEDNREQVREYIRHVKRSTNEMLDIIDSGKEYQERFDITITMNGKSITIGNHANNYTNLVDLLYGEIEEESCHILEPDV